MEPEPPLPPPLPGPGMEEPENQEQEQEQELEGEEGGEGKGGAPPPPRPAPSKFEDIFRLLHEGRFPTGFGAIQRKNLKRYAHKFRLEGGCLYYVGPKKEEKREVVADPERRRQIFLESHFTETGNHLGQKKTVHRIQSRYYWLGIVKDVVDWIKTCETCQNAEHVKNLLKKPRPVRVESPWEVLGLDVYGPFPESSQGNTHVLAVMDHYSKWMEAIPLQKRDAFSVAKGLSSLFYRFAASKNIFCNLNWDFCEEVVRLLLERWNISQLLTPSDPASCTRLDSRTNELLKSAVYNLVNEKPSDWDETLDPVLFELRTAVSPVTKYTPFFLLHNRYACLSSKAAYIKDSSKEEGTDSFKNNGLPSFSAAAQEQQNAVKEIVIANMAASYKQEQKGIRKKSRSLSSLTYKIEDGTFEDNDEQAVKRLKKNQFMSFHFQAVLPPEESLSSMKKTS